MLSAAPYRQACCAQETNKDQGKAWGHAGIVAAASAVLADLEKGGILKVCFILRGTESWSLFTVSWFFWRYLFS